MLDAPWARLAREITLAAFGVSVETFEPWVVDRFADLLVEEHVRRGQVLVAAGTRASALYFMHHGRVRAEREGASPWTFEGRWLLGGYEANLDRPATRSLVALEDFYALRIPARGWSDLLADSFELARTSVAYSAATVARLADRLGHALDAPALELPPSSHGRRPLTDRIAFLSAAPMTRGAGIQALADLASIADEILLGDGESLLREDQPSEIHFVMEGRVEAARNGPDVQRVHRPGELVAGAAALSEDARRWRARAQGPARVLRIPRERWFDLMEDHVGFARAVIAALAVEREAILDRLAEESGPEGIVLT